MPVRQLPSNPDLTHLRYQAKDLLDVACMQIPLVDLLCDGGADLNLRHWTANVAWRLANHEGKKEIERYLRAVASLLHRRKH